MAIRVGGTIVIDDSRNICNTANISVTTANATTVCGTTVCGTFCGGLGAVSASNLTNVPVSDLYICMTACEAITAGSPVSVCGTCGVVSTKGGPPNYCLGAPYGCIISTDDYNNRGQVQTTITALNFACNPNCFVTVMFSGGGGYCTGVCTGVNCSPYACIRTHAVSASGTVTSTCFCCYNYGPTGTNALCCVRCIQWGVAGSGGWCDRWVPTLHGPMPLCSCTGASGGIIVPVNKTVYCCYTGQFTGSCTLGIEFYFCYCTTTCTIALLRHCHGNLYGGDPNVNAVAYVTNDRQYAVVPFCASKCNCCGQDCACVCTGLYVKKLNDAMCLLSWTPAVSCSGVSWKDVLPSSCAYLATRGYMGYPGTMPFTQGADGWTLNYYETCYDVSLQTQPKIWAHRAVADNCYAMSNILCTVGCLYIPYHCGNGLCLACGDATYSVGNAGSFAWDEATCKKMISSLGSVSVCICSVRINCFCVSGTTLTQTSYSDGTLYCCAQNGSHAIMYNFANKNTYTNVNYSQVQDYAGHASLFSNGMSPTFASGTMINQIAMYNASLPLCYQCSCYVFSGYCEVLMGREACYLHSAFGSLISHNVCWSCWGGCDFVGAYAFKPSYGGGYVNSITQCGSNGSGQCAAGLTGLNLFPFYNNSNTIITSAVSSRPYPGTGCYYCCLCSAIGSLRIGYCEATVCNWYGIAQSSAAAGANVCIAVPGMVDRSPFSTNLSTYVGACCLQVGFNCSQTVSTPRADNQLTIGTTVCGRLCVYGNNIIFKPFYDTGKGCYVTQITSRMTYQSGGCGNGA